MARPPLPAPALVALLGLAACAESPLAQSWQLDRLRILGVRAEPAEPRPGERVSFSSLVYTPAGVTLEGTLWFACLPASSDEFGCEIDPAVFEALQGDLEDASPEELAELYQQAVEAGFVGYEPLLPPTWVAPTDALDGLSPIAQEEGLSAIVNVTAIPEGAEDGTLDPDAVELAYKRVPVSLSETPNHNPELVALHVRDRGTDLVADAAGAVAVARGHTYTLVPELSANARETYRYRNGEGVVEERTEQPYASWYAEGGEFDQPFSLFPHEEVAWTAPARAFEGLVVVVVRDRRGGMAWRSVRVRVE